MSDSDDDIDEQLTQARALLQYGNKVFLQHNHKPGYLNEKAPWNGEYHLAHVQESYNPTTNSCKVLWKRDGNGYGVTVSYMLNSPTQVKSAFDYANMVVLIEDDWVSYMCFFRIEMICYTLINPLTDPYMLPYSTLE